MLYRSFTLVILLALNLTYAVGRDDNKYQTAPPPVELLAPKESATVSEVEELEGRLTKGGWPVIVVQPQLEGALWWVQPAVEEVVDSQFTGRAHFGDKDTPKGSTFALVVLVAKSKDEGRRFKSGMTLKELPPELQHSKEIIVTRGVPSVAKQTEPRTLDFSGQTWQVKAGRRLGPGPNDFSDAKENVWLDEKGRLHLAITWADDRWQCAEVVANKSLGYGEYIWVVSGDLPTLDRRLVLGLFTYETTEKEIDFELSRWGKADQPNAQFVVQPYQAKDSTHRFDTAKAKVLTCSVVWEKDQVRCRCWMGEDTTREPLAYWKYLGRNIPAPGKERARANLWLFEGKSPSSGERQEVVIQSFKFESAGVPK